MQLRKCLLRLIGRDPAGPGPGRRRRPRKVILTCDPLEGRITPSHAHVAHHVAALVHSHHHSSTSTASSTSTTGTTTTAAASMGTSSGSSSSGSSSSSSSSSLSGALSTLRDDVLTIEQASGTTIGELATIRAAFNTLSSDGLTPSSESALESFENSLVTAHASGTTLTGNSTLLSQFEALYTSSPTDQQTTDLTAAYNALAAAVTSSNITSSDITTIDNDWSAVLAAEGSTSTSAYPYFSLVTGRGLLSGPGHGGGGC
jgi:hypothetical protein